MVEVNFHNSGRDSVIFRRCVNALFITLLACIALTSPSLLAQNNGPSPGAFTLNLKNTDIESLISTVSKQTGLNFVIDPRVKAKVTVISSSPMNADELYEVFLSVLQIHGFSTVPSGDVIKIVPDVSAKQSSVPNLRSGSDSDQLVTHVIRIANVPAAQLVPILRPLVPQQGHLAAYTSTNSLVITDRSSNIKRLVGIIKRIDRPDNDEIEFIRLKHAAAPEVVRILSNLATTGGQPGQQQLGAAKLAADDRTNSVLISGNPASRLRLRGLIANLDTPLESGGNTKVIYLKYANAKDMAAIIQGVSAGQAKVGVGEAAVVASTTAASRGVGGSSSNVDIQADEHTNSLIITAPPDAMRNILAVIRQLDIRRAQVLVEAIIAEISGDKSRDLGISFAAVERNRPGIIGNLGGGLGALAASASGGAAAAGALSGLNGTTLGLGNFDGSGTNFGFLVRAIASDAANNILSTPSLLTLDNQEAEIVVGQNVPFVTGQTLSADNTNPFQTIERRDVGLTLKVKPQINEGNSIKMEISQEVSSVNTSAQASDIITNTRAIKTTVLIDDDQTLVLGGLIQDDANDTQEKVPLLGDIPILGRLFQYRSTQKRKQNLMVFLHPKILRDRDTADKYSSEKYSYLRSKQMIVDENGISLFDDNKLVLPELELMFKGQLLDAGNTATNNHSNNTRSNHIVSNADSANRASTANAVTAASTQNGNFGQLSRLRVNQNNKRTRLILDVDRDVGRTAKYTENGDGSLTITLPDVKMAQDFANPDYAIDRVRKLSVDQQGDNVKIHLVPAQPATYGLQLLPPSGRKNYRFLIDIRQNTNKQG